MSHKQSKAQRHRSAELDKQIALLDQLIRQGAEIERLRQEVETLRKQLAESERSK